MANVLLLEDDADLRLGLEQFLQLNGYRVQAFGSSRALQSSRTAQTPWDAVVSDYHLADVNGVEVVRRLRARWPKMPAAIMTSARNAGALRDVNALPNACRLLKPFDPAELLPMLEGLIGRIATPGAA